LPGSKALAYLSSSPEKKSFCTIDARCKWYETFFFLTDNEAKQATALVPVKSFKHGVMFAGKARRDHLKTVPLNLAPALLEKKLD
jgi:hypothetical protein